MKLYYYLVALMILLFSCESDITFEPPKEVAYPVSVSCILSDSDVQTLKLTYSRKYHKGYFFEEVPEAHPRLYRGDALVGEFTKSDYATWQLNYHPVLGAEYRLEVDLPGGKRLRAVTEMPKRMNIKRGNARKEQHIKEFIQRRAQDPYWIFNLSSSLNEPQYIVITPSLDADDKKELAERIGTNHKDADKFNDEDLNLSDPHRYEGGTVPFKYYIRVSPKVRSEEQEPYRFIVRTSSEGSEYIVFRAVSSSYDRYLKSIIEKATYYEAEDDPARWFDQVSIYSNIENGVGIFGAYTQVHFFYNNRVIAEEP